jgi:hypothetical protein
VTARRPGLFLGAACVLVCLAALDATSATATTGPGVSLLVKGTLTNSTITLVHTSRAGGSYVSSNGSAATFVRGTRVIFRFTNKGNKPYLPAIKVLLGPYMPAIISPADRGSVYTLSAQRVAPPGGQVDFAVTFLYRGGYRLMELLHKHPLGRPIEITIT